MKPSSGPPSQLDINISVCISLVVSPYGSKSRGGGLSCVSVETYEFPTALSTAPV